MATAEPIAAPVCLNCGEFLADCLCTRCVRCGELLDDAGDGWCDLCADCVDCADAAEDDDE
jgi:hypothetical protein